MNPRFLWAFFYAAVNVIALFYSLHTRELLGDGAGFAVQNESLLIVAALMLIASVAAMYAAFSLLVALTADARDRPGRPILMHTGLVVLIVAFIGYVQLTGLFVAGSSERGGTFVSALFVLFNVDLLFFIYYAASRDRPEFRVVGTLWLISVIQRGWFGYIFVVAALESIRIIRQRRMKLWWVLLVVLLVPAFPFLDALKVFVRLNPGVDLGRVIEIAPGLMQEASLTVADVVSTTVERIVGRIQVLSHAVIIMDNRHFFQSAVESAAVAPFWKEGLFGVLYDRLAEVPRMPESSQLLASFIVPETSSAWNVNPSLVGWFYIYAGFFPITLLYVAGLCCLSVILMKRISDSRAARDALWFYWLIFLLPGWISQFASFVATMLMVVVLGSSVRTVRMLIVDRYRV